MKKIIKLFILICFCFMPFMVDAKANFDLKKVFENQLFFYAENDEYYYVDMSPTLEESVVKVYNSNDELIREEPFMEDGQPDSPTELFSGKYMLKVMNMMYMALGVEIIQYDDSIAMVSYEMGEFNILDLENFDSIYVKFTDDEAETKKILGRKYDLYLELKKNNVDVFSIFEVNDYYLVRYYVGETDLKLAVYNNNFSQVLNIDLNDINIENSDPEEVFSEFQPTFVYDDLIYFIREYDEIDIYKLDGTKIQTLAIEDLISSENGDTCSMSMPFNLYIKNNELIVAYLVSDDNCDSRIDSAFVPEGNVNNNINSFDYAKEIVQSPTMYYTRKYNIDYDVTKVDSSNGSFTYTDNKDNNGTSYVELKIEPKPGYSVEEIIVTDINGNRIYVDNNKFVKPLNDVQIEVKYRVGEYLPIPDTGLSQSITLIIIGLILIGLGSYTFKYVKE